MKTVNNVFKWVGIALAIFLSLQILLGISFGALTLYRILGNHEVNSTYRVFDKKQNENHVDIKSLKISLGATKLIIKEGDSFKVETNNQHIKMIETGSELKIKETKHIFNKWNDYELVLSLPKEMVFDDVDIEAGAMAIDIEFLKTNILDFDFGAGKTNIKNLEVYQKASLDGGVGEIQIQNGEIRNLDLDMGVGNFDLTANLFGKIELESGVGRMNINILNKRENYNILATKGIGSISIDGKPYQQNVSSTGENDMKIAGGIGEIRIQFKDAVENMDDYAANTTTSKIKIIDTLKTKEEEVLLIGTIVSGSFQDANLVSYVVEGKINGEATLRDQSIKYVNYDIEKAVLGQKVFFTLDNIDFEQASQITEIQKD